MRDTITTESAAKALCHYCKCGDTRKKRLGRWWHRVNGATAPCAAWPILRLADAKPASAPHTPSPLG